MHTEARPPLPPAPDAGDGISLTIRKRASSFVPTLAFFAATGYFDALDPSVDWVAWFTERVIARKTFLIGGNTGSSKTTLAEALIRAIPLHERILTIEKTAEFAELPHQGWLAQYYGYTGDGAGSEKAAVHLLETALRQRPDRILFDELRSAGEAWAYLRGLKAGHPGGITTIHSGSAEGTVTALATMMCGDLAGATMSDDHLRAEVRDNVDVLVHCASKPYRITQSWKSGDNTETVRAIACDGRLVGWACLKAGPGVKVGVGARSVLAPPARSPIERLPVSTHTDRGMGFPKTLGCKLSVTIVWCYAPGHPICSSSRGDFRGCSR